VPNLLAATDEPRGIAEFLETLTPDQGSAFAVRRLGRARRRRPRRELRRDRLPRPGRGDGLEVHGPAEALLMGLAGRAEALDELDGPG
jgi:hypothetical protein